MKRYYSLGEKKKKETQRLIIIMIVAVVVIIVTTVMEKTWLQAELWEKSPTKLPEGINVQRLFPALVIHLNIPHLYR